MPKRSQATIQARMVEKALKDREPAGTMCPVCGHATLSHRRMRNASFCEECHKGCSATSNRPF